MQQFITSSEAHALLDRVLQTSQSLNAAIARYVRPVVAAPVPVIPSVPLEAPVSPAIVEEPTVLPEPKRSIAPVLTIKLADLLRESRRDAHEPIPIKPPFLAKPRPRPPYRRPLPEVEVLYRKGFRMVS